MIVQHLSHTDLDGYGAQFFMERIKHKFEKINYYNVDYNNISEKLNTIFKTILKLPQKEYYLLITDLNLRYIDVKKINNFIRGNKNIKIKVQLLDHHTNKETIKFSNENEWYYLNNDKCGSMLSFENALTFLSEKSEKEDYKKENEYIAQIIQSYDLWEQNNKLFYKGNYLSDMIMNEYKYPELLLEYKRKHNFRLIKEITAAFQKCKNIKEVESLFTEFNSIYINEEVFNNEYNDIDLHLLLNDDIPTKLKFCRLIYHYFLKEDKSKIININGAKGKFIYDIGTENFQNVSNFYLNEKKEIDFLVHVKKNGKMSFRSRNKVDVSKIANKFGGGGHKQASGAYDKTLGDFFDQKTMEKVINNKLFLHLKQNFK